MSHSRWRIAKLACSVLIGVFVAVGSAVASAELLQQGMQAYRRGALSDAARLLESAVNSFSSRVGEKHPDTLTSMGNLALTYGALGRTVEQLALNEKVLQLRTEIQGDKHPDTLTSMGNLGATHLALGRTAEALALNEKVLRLSTEVLGDKHPDTVRAMNNLAGSYGALGRTSEQLALNETVSRLLPAIFGERHPYTLTSMSNLASTYHALGRTADSLALVEKVLRLRTEILGDRHPDTLRSMNNLADAYGTLGRTTDALALNEKVLRLRTEILGDKHPDTLSSMSNLAFTYGALGRTAEQLPLSEKVVRLRTEILGERHRDTLRSMNNLAETYRSLGRTAEQLALNEKVPRLSIEVLGERHPDTLGSMDNAAYGYMAAGQPMAAVAFSERYVTGAEWQRSQPGLVATNRQSVFQRHARVYRRFAVTHGALGQMPQALRLSELSKARTLLEGMAAQRAGRAGALPADEQARLDALDHRAVALDARIAQAGSAQVRQTLESTRNDVAREYGSLQSRLKRQYPKYAQLADVSIVSGDEVPALLEANALAVSYLVSDSDVGAFVATSAGPMRYVALGSLKNLADAVEIVRLARSHAQGLKAALAQQGRRAWRLADGSVKLLEANAPAPRGASEITDDAETTRALSRLLLQPLEAELKARRRWIVSPDGPLALLPFETLPFGADDRPAVASAEIHYTQSLSVYALSRQLQRQHAALSDRKSLFAMGDARYEPEARTDTLRRGALRSTSVRAPFQLRELDGAWSNLPGTEAEVKAVAALFPGSADTFLGTRATEEQLLALNSRGQLRNYRYLLFSAHGYVSHEQPALSSIVLGLVDRSADTDGYITASEWPGYDLRSDLTVLSACDTGVGQVLSGEGVMGLPFALFVAGNVNTLLTLWPVDDRATTVFVTSLFKRLKSGESAARALASTKREFMQHPRYSHPGFWAAFVLVGAG